MPLMQYKVLGLDIGSSSIKWIIYGSGKRCVIYDWGISQLPAGWMQEGKIVDSPGLAMKIKHIIKGSGRTISRASISISSPEMIVRTIYIPRLIPKEIHNVVKYEMEYLIPTDVEKYVFDYKVLGEEMYKGSLQLRVLLCALPLRIIREYLQLLDDLGLRPQNFDFHGNGVSRIVGIPGEHKKSEGQMIVDIGESTTVITFVEKGAPFLIRFLQKGSGEMTHLIAKTFNLTWDEAERWKKDHGSVYPTEQKPDAGVMPEVAKSITPFLEQLLEEIHRSGEFYKSRSGHDLNSVTVAGGGSYLKGLSCYIASSLNLTEASFEGMPPLDRLGFPKDGAARYINVLGLAVGYGKIGQKDVNLLPEEYRNIGKKKRTKRARAAAYVLACILAAGTIVLPINYRNRLEIRNKKSWQEMGNLSIATERRQLGETLERDIAERTEIVSSLRALDMEWASLLMELREATPSGVCPVSTTYSESGVITIHGVADDYNVIARFVADLQSIKEIKTVQPVKINLSDRDTLNFGIRCFVGGIEDG